MWQLTESLKQYINSNSYKHYQINRPLNQFQAHSVSQFCAFGIEFMEEPSCALDEFDDEFRSDVVKAGFSRSDILHSSFEDVSVFFSVQCCSGHESMKAFSSKFSKQWVFSGWFTYVSVWVSGRRATQVPLNAIQLHGEAVECVAWILALLLTSFMIVLIGGWLDYVSHSICLVPEALYLLWTVDVVAAKNFVFLWPDCVCSCYE